MVCQDNRQAANIGPCIDRFESKQLWLKGRISNQIRVKYMPNPQDVFAKYLADKSLKTTPQRRLIFDTLIRQKGHLSSEELYEVVKRRDSSIGQATVYRTIKLLNDAGLVESLDFADGVMRYELRHGEEHHDHLICELCGKNIEIMDPVIEKQQEKIAAQYDFALTHHKMYLYGICSKCRKKRK